LDLDRATHRVHDACKQNEQAVAGRPYDSATMFFDFGLDELTVMGIQLSGGAFVVSAYQAAVAGYIRDQNGHQPSLDFLAGYGFSAKGEKISEASQARSPLTDARSLIAATFKLGLPERSTIA